jgi:site-specific DNA-methyltransferase (adenine-specific)
MSKLISEVTNEDCMAMMARYPDKYFDLAVVDPDFGLNEKISNGGTWAAKWKKEDGFLGGKPTVDYFTELRRVSKNQIVWGGNYFADMLPATRCWIVWDKVAHMDTLADCELAWTSFDANSKIFKHVRNTSEARIHICQKPVALYSWIFEKYAKSGDKILDTHLGSQSSRIAAHKAGLDFWGTELDKDYFKSGEDRFKKYLGLDGMFSEEHF